MIQQIQLVLSPPNDVRIPQSWSYRLYGWLMSQISSEFGEQMHLQGEHPIAHFLCFSPEKQSLIWTVNLLNDAARQVVFPVLESAKEIPLHELTLPVSEVRTFPAISAEELIRSGRSHSETRAKIAFLSPCAFKQSGRYTIFPQETLLLQSLIAHWNAAFPEYALIDSDALQALQQGLHIVDYNLHTTLSVERNAHSSLSRQCDHRGTPCAAASGTLEHVALFCIPWRSWHQNHSWNGRHCCGFL